MALLPGGVRRRRLDCALCPFLCTQDRATEIAGQWRSELWRIGVAAREAGECIRAWLCHRLREIALLGNLPEDLRLQGHPCDPHEARRPERGSADDRAATEADRAWDAGADAQRFRVALCRSEEHTSEIQSHMRISIDV